MNNRFVSEDPISFAAGDTNLNRYVGNSPVNATDPRGLVEYSESNYREHCFKEATDSAIIRERDDWQVHHVYSRKRNIEDLARKYGTLNVHARAQLRYVHKDVHSTMTFLQERWWTSAAKRYGFESGSELIKGIPQLRAKKQIHPWQAFDRFARRLDEVIEPFQLRHTATQRDVSRLFRSYGLRSWSGLSQSLIVGTKGRAYAKFVVKVCRDIDGLADEFSLPPSKK